MLTRLTVSLLTITQFEESRANGIVTSPLGSPLDLQPSLPKPTSRGAIQQRMRAPSSRWQTASAAPLSVTE